ncbi:type IV secretion system protein [Anaplasma capra]|uniref:type IV secretion system protein n=1 Tax=Anaplasma capra TaxID=1562740 RepID=UPI0021D60F09|nr:type IV secretion system protein [Anaplasma capra]MCU7611546.1 type IV secretion system protein [Anaplasma capra]
MFTIARSAANNFLRSLLLCLLVTSCGNEVPFPRCVSADNFNSSTTASVSAYYGPGNVEAFKAGDGQIGNASMPGANKHIVRWKDTGFVTDGEEIVISIEGAWVPWAKNGEKHSLQLAVNTGISRPVDPNDEFYDSVVDVGRVCGPYEKRERTVGGCKLSCQYIPETDAEDKGQYGRPCWLEKGYGAYLLFKRPEDPDPNATLDLIEYPASPTTHLGYEAVDTAGKASYHSDGKIFNSECQNIKPERGWRVYVKILDNYYYDNAGGYSLEFKKGVINGDGVKVFEYVRRLVRNELDKAGKQIFTNIAQNTGFRNFAFAVMTLFLVTSALAYLLGMVQSPFVDVIVRILKIILVIMLVSPGSWDFFHNHLLGLFTGGVDQIIALVNGYAANQKFKPDAPFEFMDVMIGERIFSTVVWEAKARALIMADWVSIFALLIIIIAVIFYVALCMYAFIIYLTAFVGITFLIALMPIMFIGIVFSRFRSLFDGWLTQCISFSMQAILMFTLVAMFGSLIMHYYYRIFGFTACYNEVVHIKLYFLGHRIIDQRYYEWTPGQKYNPILIGWGGAYSKYSQEDAGSSARYTFTGGGAVIRVPPDYRDEDFRYVDYPFLDPDERVSAPPGGVSPIKGADKLGPLASMTNSLIASSRGTSTARLVDKIKGELEVRRKDGTVTDDSVNKFLDVIKKREDEDKKASKDVTLKYKDSRFKEELVRVLTGTVISRDKVINPTTTRDLEKQYDYNIIKDIKKGYIVAWPEVFGLILVAFLVWQMRAFVQNVAVVLAGGSMLSRTVESMYSEGFIRIFSHIPVVGTVIDRLDRGIDGIRILMRAKAGDLVSTAAKAPENILRRTPIVGGMLGTLVHGTRSLAGALTTPYTEEYLYKSHSSISPRFDYARAWVGAHLGYSPLDAMKYLGGYAMGRVTGSETEGLLHNIAHDRAAFLSSLKSLTIGLDKHQPGEYAPAQKDDDSNPFTRPGVSDVLDGERGPDTISHKLFDNDGNLCVHKENFWDAVDTLHGLGVLREHAEDPEARDRIDRDMNRLRSEISAVSRERSEEVPELQEFVSPSGDVDFAGLVGHSLTRRGAQIGDDAAGSRGSVEESVTGGGDGPGRMAASEMMDDILREPDTDTLSGMTSEERHADTTEEGRLYEMQARPEEDESREMWGKPEEEGLSGVSVPDDLLGDVLARNEEAEGDSMMAQTKPEETESDSMLQTKSEKTGSGSMLQTKPEEAEGDSESDSMLQTKPEEAEGGAMMAQTKPEEAEGDSESDSMLQTKPEEAEGGAMMAQAKLEEAEGDSESDSMLQTEPEETEGGAMMAQTKPEEAEGDSESDSMLQTKPEEAEGDSESDSMLQTEPEETEGGAMMAQTKLEGAEGDSESDSMLQTEPETSTSDVTEGPLGRDEQHESTEEVVHGAPEDHGDTRSAQAFVGFEDMLADESPTSVTEGQGDAAEYDVNYSAAQDPETWAGAEDATDDGSSGYGAVDMADAGDQVEEEQEVTSEQAEGATDKAMGASQGLAAGLWGASGGHSTGRSGRSQKEKERKEQISSLQERIVELRKALDIPDISDNMKQEIESQIQALETELNNLSGQ